LSPSPTVVLTSPSTEMSEYDDNHVMSFGAAFSKPWFVPRSAMRGRVYKPPRSRGGVVERAPLGLRRLEALLLGARVGGVAIADPDRLGSVVGPETKVIGVSAKDPLGMGYVSLTYSSIMGFGPAINRLEFERLMGKVSELRARYGLKVVMGGPGVWQVRRAEGEGSRFPIDFFFEGPAEANGADAISKIIAGGATPHVVQGIPAEAEDVPRIMGPTLYGSVEVSRGCGRGCAFCSPTMQRRWSRPVGEIIADVEVNLKAGVSDVLLVTEDILGYGASGPDFTPNAGAVGALFGALRGCGGVKTLQATHANLASVKADPRLAEAVAADLLEKAVYLHRGRRVASTEVGIETGSPRLFRRHMAGKCRPFSPDDWQDIVLSSLGFLEDREWVGVGTVIVGMPDETEDDTRQTQRLIDEIVAAGLRTMVIPILFVPLGSCSLRDGAAASFDRLTDGQIGIFTSAWEQNIRQWGAEFFRTPPYNSFISRKAVKHGSRILQRLKYSRSEQWRSAITGTAIRELAKVA